MDDDIPYSVRKRGVPYYDMDALDSVESDRPRGILTSDDRDYLIERGDDRSEHASDRKQTRLRSRVRNGIMDFTLLYTLLSDEDRVAVFDPPGQSLESQEEMDGSLISLLAFVYDGIERTGGDFDSFLETAKEEVERRKNSENERL